jgi:catechol 2,3-dioxygenase-like lactoylglutathione lyase family enzyme
MTPKIDIINIGVGDLDRARAFYEHGSGCAVREEANDTLTLSFGGDASRVALRPWDAVASDAGVGAQTSGFRGFTLSYILDSAEGVDEVLRRAEAHGGRVSKAPKNAVWGYSAYVTDPGGYLWKIASSKRHPLLGRKEVPARNGHPVEPQEVPITIGVADMKRAKQFYKDGIGLPVKKSFGSKFVMFEGRDGTSDLGMYKREALADDAAVPPEGSGFRGFSITHLVETAERVDAMLADAVEAGGTLVKSAQPADGGGYSGYFADPDGNLWKVASRT